MKKSYNKLVRDKIPEIIEKGGRECRTEILSDEKYVQMLDAKLIEELSEYQAGKELEELADLQEVIIALVAAKGVSWTEFDNLRIEKLKLRGGFSKKILLKEVIDKKINPSK